MMAELMGTSQAAAPTPHIRILLVCQRVWTIPCAVEWGWLGWNSALPDVSRPQRQKIYHTLQNFIRLLLRQQVVIDILQAREMSQAQELEAHPVKI